MAEGNGLLNRHRAKSLVAGSNPALSAISFQYARVSRPPFLSRRMRPAVVIVLLAALSWGCDTSRNYFFEDRDGHRYYETKSGKILHVSPAGTVYQGPTKVGRAVLLPSYTGDVVVRDWDMKAYEVVPPSEHCSSQTGDEVKPAPCWQELFEFLTVVAVAPAAAVARVLPESAPSAVQQPPTEASAAPESP